MQNAACAGLNPALFFPERGNEAAKDALEVCGRCTVRDECLDYAMTHNERDGVWGGCSGRQRRQLRSAKALRDTVCECRECGNTFMGTYRMLICSDDCRRQRQTRAHAKSRAGQ
jgi:hypothetical protein